MLTIGIPYEVAWTLNPKTMKPFEEAFENKKKMLDSQMWMMGYYVYDAVLVAVENNLAGSKSKNKYFEKPIMQVQAETNGELSEEQKMQQVNNFFSALEIRKFNFEQTQKSKQGKDN